MREAISLTGMVLSAAPAGDYDKRLVILSRERGRITAFAHGARKSTSELRAAANPFVFGSFQVYEGRTAYTLGAANVKDYFTELAALWPGVYYGYYFLEIADYYGQEGNPETDMLNLLYMTLRALMGGRISNRLIRVIFEWKALVINGEYPEVFRCALCGKETETAWFSMNRRGICCADCKPTVRDAKPLSPTALYTLRYITGAPIDRLYRFAVMPDAERELAGLSARCMEQAVDRRLKSLEILREMDPDGFD